MKGDRMAKRSSFGSIVRKRLSDITNSVPQPRSPIDVDKISPDASSAKNYINHLLKENMALAKLVQDKNKIIELSGVEIQKLRINLQRMQLQNWNLAQSNSHMLAELNLNREKIRTLQHEVVCREASLKARNLEEELQGDQLKNGWQDGEVRDSQPNKARIGNRRQLVARSRSMGHSTSSKQAAEKEAAENKRQCLRRRSSASLKIPHSETADILFELEGYTVPFNSPVHTENVDLVKDEKGSSEIPSQRSQRTSIGGRPSRKAAEKVQSYKEIPLNIKMRRGH